MTTMRDVAQKAGVSSTTVSLVLNGRQPMGGPISVETQERVWAVARELGYRRNGLVQAVVSGHNRTLGFLAQHLHYEFISRVMVGAIEEARAAGYSVLVIPLHSNRLDREAIETCLEMRLAGLITLDMTQDALAYLHSEMRPHGVPIAFLDTSFRQDWGIHITSDDERGCHLAIDHLVQLGHKRIAFIGGEVGRGMAISRDQAFRDAMAFHGLEVPAHYFRHAQWKPSRAQQCALEMLQLPERPTAIFCASDGMVIGVQRAARQLSLQMPRDLSVVGFANLWIADMADPALTTINQPKDEMGRTAVRLLLDKLKASREGGEIDDRATDVLLPTELVVRDSTAVAPF
ncbi:HTH-type transcriptional repressor PurR [Abditibacteriota bacterium]|nr:HTH-type transcriptional repressor PurR [Abditibacteriota bacterium]